MTTVLSLSSQRSKLTLVCAIFVFGGVLGLGFAFGLGFGFSAHSSALGQGALGAKTVLYPVMSSALAHRWQSYLLCHVRMGL